MTASRKRKRVKAWLGLRLGVPVTGFLDGGLPLLWRTKKAVVAHGLAPVAATIAYTEPPKPKKVKRG